MMVKILGAMLVILACSGAGYLTALEFVNRTKQIRQLQNALLYIETEIMYGYTPLNDLMKKISQRENGSISLFFLTVAEELETMEKSFQHCWQTAIDKRWKYTSLKEKERQIMLQLGSILGMSDRENQQKHIRIALSHMQAEEKEAYEAQTKYEKMSRTLGVLTGILLVLLMF